jgi:hypothetical protein
MNECKHFKARYLDCDECKKKMVICEEFVCVDCGESVDIFNYDYRWYVDLYYIKESRDEFNF